MSSMASAGWCIEHLFQQNNDIFSCSSNNSSSSLHAYFDDRRATVFQLSLPLVVPVMSLDQAVRHPTTSFHCAHHFPSHLDNLLHTAL